jgi:tetratricopeptide (TPR) repeat protein
MACARITDEGIMGKYLLGQLGEAEQEEFEKHFFECEECFRELEALQAAQQVLASEPISRALQIQRPQRFKTWGWAVAAAAVVVIGLVALLWWVMQPPIPRTASLSPELAELARIEPPFYEALRLRGTQDDAQRRFKTAMEFYSAGDYASAIPGLEEAAELDPTAPNVSFFLGASYLLADRTSEGILLMQDTVDLGDTPFLEEALVLLAKGRLATGDVVGAEVALAEAVGLRGEFESEARDVLTKLREVPVVR